MLVTFDRIRLDRPLRDWLEAASATPIKRGVTLEEYLSLRA